MHFFVDGTAIRIKFNKAKLTICSKNTYDSRNFAVGGDKGWKLAELNVGQVAFYAQDDWNT
jgi:hypothetical protein